MSPPDPRSAPLISWRGHGPLLVLLAVHAVAAVLLWRSGAPAGTWHFECAVGALGWDAAHGLNPHYALSDYYDSWTSGYLLTGLFEAPLMALPWRPILAVKATALLLHGATVTLAWLFLWRNVGPWAARVGAAALVLCPPLLWFYSLHAGDYHYTELGWAFAAACLVGEVVRRPGRTGRWYLGVGLVCGLAITNSFGSLAHVAVCLALLLVLAPQARALASLVRLAAGLLIGAGPILYKLLLHQPFGGAAGAGSYQLPYTSGTWTLRLLQMKLRSLPEGFASHLSFADGLHRFVQPQTGLVAGLVWTGVAVAAVLVVLVLARRGGLRLLLALSLLGWLAAFCSVTSIVVARPPELDEYLDARYLPPIVGLLAANLGVAAQVLIDARPGRATLALVLAVCVPLLGVCLLSWNGLFLDTGLSDGGIPYRGRCYDMLGLYSSKHVHEMAGGAPTDRWLPQELCAGFDEEVRSDCFLGRVMGVAMKRLDQVALQRGDPSSFEPPVELLRSCEALPGDWRRDCYRHAGWTLNWPAQSHPNQRGLANLVDLCAAFGPGPEQGWCLEGAGYQFAGHYGALPWKLPGLLPDDEQIAAHVMRGFGFHLAHTYAEQQAAGALCGVPELSEGLRVACVDGVAAGFEVYERAFPPWSEADLPAQAGQGEARPDVVLVVVDALRADRTSALEPDPGTTPRLARLGQGGVVYRQAVAPSSWSWPSVASLFTGQPIADLSLDSFAGRPTLAEAFAQAGYRTVARVENPTLTLESGFARGFDEWSSAESDGGVARSISAVLAELAEPDPRPLFLYVHLFAPHEPYEARPGGPPIKRGGWSGGGLAGVEGGWARTLGAESLACLWDVRSRYDAEVTAVDDAVDRLLDGLDAARPNPRVVAVTSDHGEGLYSHPVAGVVRGQPSGEACDALIPGRYRVHGDQRFEEAIRVPLWLAGPGVPRGRVEERQVAMADLGGALLRLAGIDTPRSGLPLSDDQPASPRVFGADRAGVFVRTPALKLMVPHLGRVGQSRRLVEVEGGGYAPELEDVSAGRPDDLARLEAELAAWRAQASSKSGDQAAVNGER